METIVLIAGFVLASWFFGSGETDGMPMYP